jgi:hypothetical protein
VNLDTIGRKASEVLRDDPVVDAIHAEWVHDASTGKWWFVAVTGYADTHGLRAAYGRVRHLLEKADLLEQLPLQQVFVVPVSDWQRTRKNVRQANLLDLLGLRPTT